MFYHTLPKDGVIRKAGRKILRIVKPYHDPRAQTGSDSLNLWQEGFCVWNAERLGIPLEEAVRRYRRSWNVLPGGHGGDQFRDFCETSMEVFSVIADDNPQEVYESYKLHSWLFLLRQIGLPVPAWGDDHPVIRGTAGIPAPVIIDYGCGLAQESISLALALRARGCAPRLVLADIPTLRLDFVSWLARRQSLPCEVLPCTREHPLPDFPPAEVVVATQVFEHVHDPLPAFERLSAALRPGGFMVTHVDDHEEEFMHVCTNLQILRDRLAELGYAEIDRYMLYRKSMAAIEDSATVAMPVQQAQPPTQAQPTAPMY